MRLLKQLLFLPLIMGLCNFAQAEKELTPYLHLGNIKGTVVDVKSRVEQSLIKAGFEVIGDYQPEGNKELAVLVYTSKKLQEICLKVKDRGALAAALKVGFKSTDGVVEISIVNPEYLFNAYFQESYKDFEAELMTINKAAKKAVNLLDLTITNFGGVLTQDDVQEYQYMWGMEEFTDPVELMEFNSFEEGLTMITKNLNAKKGSTSKVYELVFKDEQVAVFGVALEDAKTGEPFFLPVIGEKHVAAMPYELILQGNTATILHGRYRIALHWPELTMGTFTKIMSTPGDVEATMKSLCE